MFISGFFIIFVEYEESEIKNRQMPVRLYLPDGNELRNIYCNFHITNSFSKRSSAFRSSKRPRPKFPSGDKIIAKK